MNLKKSISKIMTLVLAAGMLFSIIPTVNVKASEKENKKWNTLVVVCRRVDIPNGIYNGHGVTQMNDSEVNRIKNDASKLEEIVNSWSANKANMNIDVEVSDIPITTMSVSSAYGHYIDPIDISKAIDKYAPEGKYDSVVVVYRDKDYSTSLSTNEFFNYSKDSTNGATYSTVALKDKDHSMNFADNNYPMYLLEPLTRGLYAYYRNNGHNVKYPEYLYMGGDKEQFNKAKRDYYRTYFKGITNEMWSELPTDKLK